MPKPRKDGQPKKSGRPRKFTTPEELDAMVDAYFADESITPKTVTGLSLYLGFVSRPNFYEYENNAEFKDSIKKARHRVENVYESRLHENNPTGAIFALKNMGWRDRQDVEHTGKDGGPVQVTVTVVNKPKESAE